MQNSSFTKFAHEWELRELKLGDLFFQEVWGQLEGEK